jgi:hypothetical protein
MAKLTTKEKIEKYLTIEEHRIVAYMDLIIRIDSDELKLDDEELVDVSDESSETLVGSIKIPGILNIEVQGQDELQLYFQFDINLVIPDFYEKDGSVTTYYFNKGDLICFASTKSNATDIMVLDKLFENRVKYLRGDLQKHAVAIYDQLLSTTNVQMHHIETILTLLYGEYTDEGFIPTRLTSNQKYTKSNAISTKQSAHRFNSGVGYNYGYTKDAVSDNITRTYDPEKTDLEKIIAGRFDELGK